MEFIDSINSQMNIQELLQREIPDDRAGLAQECWNLRKVVFDLNSHILKTRTESKSSKRLMVNLKSLTDKTQKENSYRISENNTLKAKIANLEKKNQDLNVQNNILTNGLTRQKKLCGALQGRITDSERSHSAKLKELDNSINSLKNTIKEKEELLKADTKKLLEEIKKLTNDKDALESIVNQNTLKIDQLEKENSKLILKNESLTQDINDVSKYLNRELEAAYEILHNRTELAINDRQDFRRKYLEKLYEVEQIQSFLLSEGLELPKLHALPPDAQIPFPQSEIFDASDDL